MGKRVKKLTNLIVHMEEGTTLITAITIDVKDIKRLVDKNGFLIVLDGKIDPNSIENGVDDMQFIEYPPRAKKAIAYNRV